MAVSGAAGHMNRAQPHEPRQRCPLHRLVRRPGAWQDARHPLGTPRRGGDSRARDARARPAVVRDSPEMGLAGPPRR